MSCLIELHYLPCIAYFSCISRFDTLIIEKHEHYEKQTYRNRCRINSAQGPRNLIVPITSKHARMPGKPLISEVQIDYSQKWLNNHWRTLSSAYRKAPYWEHYADDLHQCLFRKHTFLYDLNFELLTICLRWLMLEPTFKESASFEKVPESGTQDLRNVVNAKNPEGFKKIFFSVAYQQVFGKSFAANLSLIDLVFCEGPNARNIVIASAIPHEQIKMQ